MEHLQQYWVQWLVSNIIGVLLIVVALWRPRVARLLLVLLFGWASWINYTISHNNPEDYLVYGTLTPFNELSDFINGWFRENVIAMVTMIAVGQGLIALGLLLKEWSVWIACIGAIVFLLAIAPLGIGSGFPFSITASIAIYIILKKNNLDLLWKGQHLDK